MEQYDFDLPDKLIARYPARERRQARMLLADCRSLKIHDSAIAQLPAQLARGDVLVLNNARVIPARFQARLLGRASRTVECLFLGWREGGLLEIMGKPMRRLREGARLDIGGRFDAVVARAGDSSCLLRLDGVSGRGDGGEARRRAGRDGACADGTGEEGAQPARLPPSSAPVPGPAGGKAVREGFGAWLDRHGETPLPPYLGRAAEPSDAIRYQTVYASEPGAIAAPTAGLHFDEGLLRQIRDLGVETAFLNLEVGVGSFAPIRAASPQEHRMGEESFRLSQGLIDSLRSALAEGRRIVAVGTTVVRALESAAQTGRWGCQRQATGLMIRPGFKRRIVDAMLTNFHLPRSSLMVLVCTLAGREFIQRCYAHAIERGYRFHSYGDAMFIRLDAAAGGAAPRID